MMKKTVIASALALSMGFGAAQAATQTMTSATFTMLDGTGGSVGLDTAVTGSIGDGAWAVSSTNLFFGALWTAHAGTTFGPGTYSFQTGNDTGSGLSGPTYTGIVVGAGQVGGHILFNWGATADIDVVNVWDVTDDGTTVTYTSTDVTATNPVGPDGIRGLGMIDGAFLDFNANFDFTTAVPVPAAVWLFGSGLLGLVGVARRKKAA